jgi:hypothetical protein
MARSANPAAAEPVAAKLQKPTPHRWWEMVLVYPSLAIAVLGYIPGMFDRISVAVQTGSKGLAYSSGEIENYKIWQRNEACWSSAGADFKNMDVGHYHIGVTPCSGTGDIWIRVQDKNNNDPATNASSLWIGADQFLNKKIASDSQINDILIKYAYGYEQSYLLEEKPPSISLAQTSIFPVGVLCQFRPNQSTFVRRYRYNDGSCGDDIFEAATGRLINHTPAPCSCP